MSGLPIPLEHFGLGRIHQPTLMEFIRSGIDITDFSHPFILNKEMILNRSEGVDNLLKNLGRLKFLFVYDYSTKEKREKDGSKGIIELLVDSLKIIYQTDNIMVMNMISTIIVDNNILITDDNFQDLADAVVEMVRIDVRAMRKKIEENRKRDEMEKKNPMLKLFREKEEEHKRRTSKNQDFSLIDMANVVIHSQGNIDYEKAFNMTLYQLKNSYEVIIKKEIFNVNLMHRISPNFQPTEDFKLWEDKVSVIKSVLGKKDLEHS